MAAQKTAQRKSARPQWVVSDSGEPVAVLVGIQEYNDMLRRLGEVATREEENSGESLTLLIQAEADIKAGRLTPHSELVRKALKRRRNG